MDTTEVENLGPDEVELELNVIGAVLVDVREPREAEADGSIPGAVNVPGGVLELRADPTSPYHQADLAPDTRIIVHCASGGRSARAAATLGAMGYRRVAHLEGGFAAWKDAGKPVDSAHLGAERA